MSAAANYIGTRNEREDSIYDGMEQILDEALTRHPHLRYGLSAETPEISAANRALADAVDRFVIGSLQLRRDVRPYFDRSLSAYLKYADAVVFLMRATIVWAAGRAIKDYTELDTSIETPEILAACTAFMDARDRLFRGEGNIEETGRVFHEMIAAHLDAVTPDDLPAEPCEIAA